VISLENLLRAEGVDDAVAKRLGTYGAYLLEANRTTNLTGAKTDEALLPHLLDSLSLVPYVRDPLIDVGSGGGLPAIPLAIATGVSVTMVEATLKKARFLEQLTERLGIRGRVVAERAEVAARRPDLREAFVSGTARAVGTITTAAELLLPFIAVRGIALLQRGVLSSEEEAAIADAALVLGADVEGTTSIAERRTICFIRKREATPQRFPRRAGVPEKKPLCMKPDEATTSHGPETKS
jgi:16S rRNA (guanine527-N7)-methyltransferase